MTFYWWSHWFWITLLSSVYLRCDSTYAYPSQDAGMPDYNNNNEPLKPVTKLASTSTTMHWVTTLPSRPSDVDDVVAGGQGRTRLQNISTVIKGSEASETLEQAYQSKRSNSTGVEYKRSMGALSNPSHHADEAAAAAALTEQAFKMDVAAESIEQMDSSKDLNSSVNNKHNNVTASQLAMNVSAAAAGERSSTTPLTALSLPSPSSAPSQAGQYPNGDHPPFVDWHSGPILEIRTSVPLERNDSQSTVEHKVLFTLENASKGDEMQRSDSEHRTRKSKVLTGDYKQINSFSNYPTDSKNLLARSASSAPSEYDNGDSNASSEALAIQRTHSLDASGISAICFTVFGVCCTVGTVGIVLYRRRFLNKPQALSEPDSSVYIDDSTMRDNSDEMYSLDNDSFLNSLEAMTIQNYWTDTVKHTKL